MRAKWQLRECVVIGGMRGLNLQACFSQANVVLKRGQERLVAEGFLDAETAIGKLVSEKDWRHLVGDDEATELSSFVEARHPVLFWRIGSSFPNRDHFHEALSRSHAFAHCEIKAGSIVAIVDKDAADAVRYQSQQAFFKSAWEAATASKWHDTAKLAEVAWLLGGGSRLHLESTALYALALLRTEGQEACDAILAVEINSAGVELGLGAIRDAYNCYVSVFRNQ